jgi:hypothetical protein
VKGSLKSRKQVVEYNAPVLELTRSEYESILKAVNDVLSSVSGKVQSKITSISVNTETETVTFEVEVA